MFSDFGKSRQWKGTRYNNDGYDIIKIIIMMIIMIIIIIIIMI